MPPKPDLNVNSERWIKRLISKGVPTVDIDFLCKIINPEPAARWTAEDIVASGYLEVDLQ